MQIRLKGSERGGRGKAIEYIVRPDKDTFRAAQHKDLSLQEIWFKAEKGDDDFVVAQNHVEEVMCDVEQQVRRGPTLCAQPVRRAHM